MLLKPRADFYRSEFATGADVLLVIEVGDTTLAYDREVKVPLYARHGVPEAWIVDLENGRLLVYGAPAGGEYARQNVVAAPGPMPVAELPGLTVDLSGLLAA